MSESRTQSIERSFYRSLIWCVLFSVVTFGIADENIAYTVLSTIGILVMWVFSVIPHHPAPRKLINAIVLIVISIAAGVMLRSGIGVFSFAIFATLLLIAKLLDLRSPRDCAQVLVLAVSLIIAGVLTSNTLLTGMLLLLSCVTLLKSVVYYQMYWVAHESSRTNETIDSAVRVDVRSLLTATGFLCVLMGTVVFIVLPRNLGASAFGQWGPGSGSVSGFSDTVELDRPGVITQSTTPVLDLTITDRDGMNIGNENRAPIYLRGAVLNRYSNGKWEKNPDIEDPLAHRPRLKNPGAIIKPIDPEDQLPWNRQLHVELRNSNHGEFHLFAPWRTVEIKVGEVPIRLGADFGRGEFLKDGIGGKFDYFVRTVDDGDSTPRRTQQINEDLDIRETLPSSEVHQQIVELAYTVLEDASIEPDPDLRPMSEDLKAVRVFERYLRTQFKYSLESVPVPNGDDATRWFLFDRRTGHCEYFASALTLMCRSVNIPARVITGYVASDFNSVTGQYTVRESNAHAWVEAQVTQSRWYTFDGTPPADFHSIHVPEPSLFRSLNKFYESIEFVWVRSVVGFDSNARESMLGSKIGDFGATRFANSLRHRYSVGRSKLFIRALIVSVSVFSISLGIGLFIVRGGFKHGRFKFFLAPFPRFFSQFMGSSSTPESENAIADFEHRVHNYLDSCGISKPSWKPIKEHLHDQEHVIDDSIGSVQNGSLKEVLWNASDLIYNQRFNPADSLDDSEFDSQSEQLLSKIEILGSENLTRAD